MERNTDKVGTIPQIPNVVVSLSDALKFIEWVSDSSYKHCINGEWIQTGTGDYKTVAKDTMELYEHFKDKIMVENSHSISDGIDTYAFTKEEASLFLQEKIFGLPPALQHTILEAIYRIEHGDDVLNVLEWYDKIERLYGKKIKSPKNVG